MISDLFTIDAKQRKMQPRCRPVALVTGAGRGIGRALVDELLARGYDVIAVVRNDEDKRTLSAIAPSHVMAVCCDITNDTAERELYEFIGSRVDVVDLVINNAGYGAKGFGIEGLVLTELQDLINVHCYGPIKCTRASLPFLRESLRPTIVNISSRFGSLEWVATGAVPNADATYAYRIAKASLNMLTSCLSAELQAEGIRVIAMDPGKVKTRFGPRDADTEPKQAAASIVDLAENSSQTGIFVNASGDKVPW